MAGRQFPLEILIGALDRATVPLKQINNQIDALRQPVARLQKSFSALSKEAGLFRLQRSLKEVGRAGSNVLSSLQRLSGFILGLGASLLAAGYAFERFIVGSANTAEQLKELSDVTGASIESLQTLGFVAGQVGVNQEQFTTAFTKFTKTLGELKAGTGSLFSFFNRIDPAFTRTLQKTKSTDEAFRKFIDRLRGVKNESARLALTNAAFGRGSANMANLAKLSSKEFLALENRMRSMGTISKEDADNADAFNDSWAEVSKTFENMRILLAAKFFPVLRDLAKQLTNWLIKNRPQLEAFANQLALQLPGAIEKLGKAFKDMYPFAEAIFKLFGYIAEHTVILKAGFIALATYIVGPVILAIAQLTTSLLGLSLTFLATPLGWFLIALSSIALAVYRIVENWQLLKATFLDVIDSMLSKLETILGKVKEFASSIPIIGKYFGVGSSEPGSKIVQRANIPDSPKSITKDANVTVTFENAPPGLRVQKEPNASMVDLDVGYQFGVAGAFP